MNVSNYDDSFSLQGTALFDLHDVEIGVRASQRLFLSTTSVGQIEQSQLSDHETTLGLQIARYYVTRDRHYGRLSAEYLRSLPNSYQWLRFGLNAGTLETAEQPWSLQLHASYFAALTDQDSFLSVTGETAKLLDLGATGTLKIGGEIFWTARVAHQTSPDFVYEHMLLSLGPTIEWSGGLGHLRLFIPFRLWIDYENITQINPATGQPVLPPGTSTPITNPQYPSEWPLLPGISLSWMVLL